MLQVSEVWCLDSWRGSRGGNPEREVVALWVPAGRCCGRDDLAVGRVIWLVVTGSLAWCLHPFSHHP